MYYVLAVSTRTNRLGGPTEGSSAIHCAAPVHHKRLVNNRDKKIRKIHSPKSLHGISIACA